MFGQRSQLWYQLPARETFALLARVYEVDRHEHRRRLARLVERFELGSLLDKPVSQLSLGERMRAEITASLLHHPKLLFLDEPTIGLDVSAKAQVRALLREQSEQDGATLLLTSHDTGDIESVCQRVTVIHGGKILWDGALSELRRRYIKTKRLTLLSDRETLSFDLPGVEVLTSGAYQTELVVSLERTTTGATVDAALRQAGLRDLFIEDQTLRFLLFSALPAGFICYVPARVLREDSLHELPLLVGVAAGFVALGIWVFQRGLRRYASGSRFGVWG